METFVGTITQYKKRLTEEELKRIEKETKELIKNLYSKGFSLGQIQVIGNEMMEKIENEIL